MRGMKTILTLLIFFTIYSNKAITHADILCMDYSHGINGPVILATGDDRDNIYLERASALHPRYHQSEITLENLISVIEDEGLREELIREALIRRTGPDLNQEIKLDKLTEHWGNVNSVAFSPDDKWLASGGNDGMGFFWTHGKVIIRKWDGDEWTESQKLKIDTAGLFGDDNNIYSVTFDQDSTLMACGAHDGNIFVSKYESNEWLVPQRLEGHKGPVRTVAFSPNREYLASGSDDKTVRLWKWNGRTWNSIGELNEPQGKVNSLAFSPPGDREDGNGKYLASGSDDNKVNIWEWTEAEDFPPYIHRHSLDFTSDVRSVIFDHTGKLLLCASGNSISVREAPAYDVERVRLTQNETIHTSTYIKSDSLHAFASVTKAGRVRQMSYFGEDLARMTLPVDLFTQVAHGENSTYFVMQSRHPQLDLGRLWLFDRRSTYKLDLPHVPTDDFLTDPGYFAFPILTPKRQIEVIRNKEIVVQEESLGDPARFILDTGFFLLSLTPADEILKGAKLLDTSLSTLYDLGMLTLDGLELLEAENTIMDESKLQIEEIVSRAKKDPSVTLEGPSGLLPDTLFLITQKIEASIDITVNLSYNIKNLDDEVLFEATQSKIFTGVDLNTSTPQAPGAQPMSLSKYLPFYLLPLDIQGYLLQHFKGIETVRKWQIPEVTSLLPNYPNPFNPETWIPYQLSEPAEVTLTIYDIQGRVVRDLQLGHQRAGMYHSRSRAAHWDGRNAVGEPVASGLYFYTLKAGDFAATRKMLIRK